MDGVEEWLCSRKLRFCKRRQGGEGDKGRGSSRRGHVEGGPGLVSTRIMFYGILKLIPTWEQEEEVCWEESEEGFG